MHSLWCACRSRHRTDGERLGQRRPPCRGWATGLTGSFDIGVTLRALIATAYAMRADRIVGLPSWAASDRFDIDAQSSVPATVNQHWLMLRVLLSGRFGLAAHHEERQRQVYALVPARANTRRLTRSS